MSKVYSSEGCADAMVADSYAAEQENYVDNAVIQQQRDEIGRLRTALELIAAHKGRTLITMDWDRDSQRAYSFGANAAFEQAADIAIEALATAPLPDAVHVPQTKSME